MTEWIVTWLDTRASGLINIIKEYVAVERIRVKLHLATSVSLEPTCQKISDTIKEVGNVVYSKTKLNQEKATVFFSKGRNANVKETKWAGIIERP